MCKKNLCPVCCSEMSPECDPPYTYLVCLYCGYPHAEDTETYEMKHLSDAYPLSKKKDD